MLLTGCATNKKYFYYQETKNELSKNNFSKVLIIGTGTSGTNLFLETLSEDLNKRLKQKQIETFYFHLGNNRTEANKIFKEIVRKNNYDAVLQFAQIDDTHNPIIISSGSGSMPTSNGGMIVYDYKYRTVRFRQKFLMKYFDFADLSHSIIDVNLDISMDFLNPRDYSRLSEKIVRSLKIQE